MKPAIRIKGGVPDEAALRDLEEIQRIVDANPLEMYFPEPKQEEFHASDARVRALIAGNRIGKTTALVIDSLIQAIPAERLPEHLRKYKKWGLPGDIPFRGRILSPGLSRTMDAAILDKVRHWCPAREFEGGSFKRAFDKQNRVIRFRSGAWIDLFSYEQDLQAHAGVALHRVSYDEEPPGDRGKAIREESRARLVDYHGDELFSLTPLLGYSYVKEAIFDRAKREDGIKIVTASMYDAPHIDQDEIEMLRGTYTEEQFRARVLGEFVHFGGLVYKEWDASRHIVPPPGKEHVQGLEVLVGVDPGIRTTGVVFAGFDRENTCLLFDELYLHDEATIPENAAQAIRERLRYWGTEEKPLEPRWILMDPSSRNRNLVTGEGVQAAYMRCGINGLEGVADRQAGVFEIKRRMQATDPQMLYVSEDMRWWRWECEKYRMKDKADGGFDVVKEDDHVLDATRWIVMAHPLPTVNQSVRKPQRRRWIPGTAPAFHGSPPPGETPPLGAFS